MVIFNPIDSYIDTYLFVIVVAAANFWGALLVIKCLSCLQIDSKLAIFRLDEYYTISLFDDVHIRLNQKVVTVNFSILFRCFVAFF